MSMLKEELLPCKEQVASPALKRFTERISLLTESEYYATLTENLNQLASSP